MILHVKSFDTHAATVQRVVPDMRQKCRVWLCPPSTCNPPFWHMKTSSDPDECNMEIISPAKGIPVAKNSCAVDAEEELVAFKEKVEKTYQPLQPVSKRQRTS